MNGSELLLDTNAFIYFFEGRKQITSLVVEAPTIYFSVITEIELLSATQVNDNELTQIRQFLNLCQSVSLTPEIIAQTIYIRRNYRLKVPDAIIAASAIVLDLSLASADTQFARVKGLQLISDIL